MARVIDLAGNIGQLASVTANANAQRGAERARMFQLGAGIGSNSVASGIERYDRNKLMTQQQRNYEAESAQRQANVNADNARQDQYLSLAKTGADREQRRYDAETARQERSRKADQSIFDALAAKNGLVTTPPMMSMPGMPGGMRPITMAGQTSVPSNVGDASAAMKNQLLDRLNQDREDQALAAYATSTGLQLPIWADPAISRDIIKTRIKLDAIRMQSMPEAARAAEAVAAMNIPPEMKNVAIASIEADPTRAYQVLDDVRSMVVKQNEAQVKQLELKANIEKQTGFLQSMKQLGILDDRGLATLGVAVQQGLYASDPKSIAQAFADYLEQTDSKSEEAANTRANQRAAAYEAEAKRLDGLISSAKANDSSVIMDGRGSMTVGYAEERAGEARARAVEAKAGMGTAAQPKPQASMSKADAISRAKSELGPQATPEAIVKRANEIRGQK